MNELDDTEILSAVGSLDSDQWSASSSAGDYCLLRLVVSVCRSAVVAAAASGMDYGEVSTQTSLAPPHRETYWSRIRR